MAKHFTTTNSCNLKATRTGVVFTIREAVATASTLVIMIQDDKKDNKQCLLDPPGIVMVNTENYKENKGFTKWFSSKSSHFAKNIFGITLLHAHAQYIFIICAKY